MSSVIYFGRLQDTGCEYHPSCLACPLPVCKEDMGYPALQKLDQERRDAGVVSVWERIRASRPALKKTQIMKLTGEELGRSTRSVYTALRRALGTEK